MKLVDILARELEEWRSAYDFLAQDSDCQISYYLYKPKINSRGSWSGKWSTPFIVNHIADDFETAIVTRSEFEVAKAAYLEGGDKDSAHLSGGWIKNNEQKPLCESKIDVMYRDGNVQIGMNVNGPWKGFRYGLATWELIDSPAAIMYWRTHVNVYSAEDTRSDIDKTIGNRAGFFGEEYGEPSSQEKAWAAKQARIENKAKYKAELEQVRWESLAENLSVVADCHSHLMGMKKC